uniref:Venom S1 protease 38 n=1 Tax=Ectomocoris sp. TaxID=3104572 RepID=A0AB38ZEH4_9HEMI
MLIFVPFLLLNYLTNINGVDIGDYMNMGSLEIDSSEFGTIPGKKSTTCPCGWTNKRVGRIVGGSETGINEFPLMAGLANGDYGYIICGASIISPYHALTAAHCTINEKNNPLAVIVGEHDVMSNDETDATRMHKIKQIIEHEKYEQVNQQHDISLLVVETKIIFTNKVGPACLQTSRVNLLDQAVKVLGWGKLRARGHRSRTLQKVNLRVIPLEICAKTFAAEIPTKDSHQICTFNYRKDACQGDSGGPVLWLDPETNRYSLVGIVSFGSGCGSDSPGITTDVVYFNKWIQQKMTETNPEATTCVKQ